jgi:hypothetical protein
MKRENDPRDFKFNYKAHIYKKIDNYLDMKAHEKILMLALLGYKNDRKYSLDKQDSSPSSANDKFTYEASHTISRTSYSKNVQAFDAVFGLIGLLDSKKVDSQETLDNIFLTTSESGLSFLELPSVKKTYEYMLGGLEVIEEAMFEFGESQSQVADSLQIFLEDSMNEIGSIDEYQGK